MSVGLITSLVTKRRNGRTARMLNEAIALSAQGRAVYIVAAHAAHAVALRRLLRREIGDRSDIKVETPDDLGNFCWETLSLRGAHPNCVVLVDHWTIESRFGRLLEMLHRYDPPTGGTQSDDCQAAVRFLLGRRS